ncbi:hypothetical protein [Pseudomonas putida]|uniref:hypothetical protein n=1 Tax=Pseudomonas putida TaxID=303 RepID=UPI00235B8B82|nr:hypothetical protein [Pseudomonas putida]GLO43965.1 hypothetical protein PPUN109347_05270 [Pseudomonas putida]HDS0980256.1 hypothetical protein [Pseudomonas putida]
MGQVSRTEALAGLRDYQVLLDQQRAISQQQELELRELTAAVRAEKAHVEQLQRQVGYAQAETVGARDDLKQLGVKLADAQSQASVARAPHAQLLQQHAELKQVHERQQSSHDVLQEKFANLSREHATLSSTLEQKQQHFAEQQQLLKDSRDQLKLEFEQLAGKIFEAMVSRGPRGCLFNT